MIDPVTRLWRQFGVWHWVLAPLGIMAALAAAAYEYAARAGASAAALHRLWLVRDGGAVLFLVLLAVAISLRFADNSYADDPFLRRIYQRNNRIGRTAAILLFSGFAMVLVAGSGLQGHSWVQKVLSILGVALVAAGFGFGFRVKIVRNDLWMRSLGAGYYSDDALESMTSYERAAKIHAPVAVAIALILAAAVTFLPA
jgi:hypothetical protein